MLDESSFSDGLSVVLRRNASVTLRRQLTDLLRDAVQRGAIPPATRLPSTRALAVQLGVSRGVVAEAYAQLAAEGFLNTRDRARPVTKGLRNPVARGRDDHRTRWAYDFSPWAPDLALFPRRALAEAVRVVLGRMPDAALDYGDPAGPAGFRDAVAARHARVRGALGTPDRVLACSGVTQGLDLVLRALHRRGARRIGVEDPSLNDYWITIRAAGCEPIPIPVDESGLDCDALGAADPDVVLTAPDHQFPTGAVLSPARRRALLTWARVADRVVLEDEYDGDYRYSKSAAPQSLQAAAPDRVIALASASKTLAPALRIGWIIGPEDLVEEISTMRQAIDVAPPALMLLAYAHLIHSGELDRHLRRVRRVYAERRRLLLDELSEQHPRGAAAGLHIVVPLPSDSDTLAAEHLARHRIHATVLSSFAYHELNRQDGLLIGFGRLPTAAIPHVASTVRNVIHQFSDGSRGHSQMPT